MARGDGSDGANPLEEQWCVRAGKDRSSLDVHGQLSDEMPDAPMMGHEEASCFNGFLGFDLAPQTFMVNGCLRRSTKLAHIQHIRPRDLLCADIDPILAVIELAGSALLHCIPHTEIILDGDLTTIRTVERIGAVVERVASQHGLAGTIAPGDFLVDKGMSSMAMVDLMLAVEAEFDVTIPQCDLTPANFQSIDALARLLDRL